MFSAALKWVWCNLPKLGRFRQAKAAHCPLGESSLIDKDRCGNCKVPAQLKISFSYS